MAKIKKVGDLVVTTAFRLDKKKIVPEVRIAHKSDSWETFLSEKEVTKLLKALPDVLTTAKKDAKKDG